MIDFLLNRELAIYTGALAKTVAMLSNCEEHTLLSRSLAHLTELEEKVSISNKNINVILLFLNRFLSYCLFNFFNKNFTKIPLLFHL